MLNCVSLYQSAHCGDCVHGLIHLQDQELRKKQQKYKKIRLTLMAAIYHNRYTCFNSFISNSHRKTILVSKHTFLGPNNRYFNP